MKKTTNLGLVLYESEDKFAITSQTDSLNANMEIIDNAISSTNNKVGQTVLFTEQTLTEEQKLQVRMNIGIVPEENEVVTKEVEYTFDGDMASNAHTWVGNSYSARLFVRVADLPDGEINLGGGTVNVVIANNHWANYNFTITNEMLDETVDVGGSDVKTKVSGFVQILYQHKGTGDNTPVTMVAVCTKPGSYLIALNGWAEALQFSETGVYFMTDQDYGGQKYIDSMTCSITTDSEKIEETEETEENPAEYDGNEIQMFTRGLCIGDSITEGVFNHDENQITIKKYSYPSVLKRITGIDIVNAGISGSTSKTWYEASMNSSGHWGKWVNDEWVWSENPDVVESDKVSAALDYSGYDFAVIHLGINDYFTMGDSTLDATISTFETNINNIINKLKTANTGIKVFLATIIPCYAVPGNIDFAAINAKIREIAEATEEVYLIDLNKYSKCTAGSPYAHIHLTALGYRQMASEISAYISYIISQNLEDFKWVQFIGTDYSA